MSELRYTQHSGDEGLEQVQEMDLMGMRVMVGLYDDDTAQIRTWATMPMDSIDADIAITNDLLPDPRE